LTSGSAHAEVLPWTICLPTLVLTAQAIFLLQRGQTDVNERPTHASDETSHQKAIRQL